MLLVEIMTDDEMRKELRHLAIALTPVAPGPFKRNVKFKPETGKALLYRYNPGMRQLENYYSTDNHGNELLIFLRPETNKQSNSTIIVNAAGPTNAEYFDEFTRSRRITTELVQDVSKTLKARYMYVFSKHYRETSYKREVGDNRIEVAWEITHPARKPDSES